MKELKSRNTEFYTYKPKQERSYEVGLKHFHITENINDIKKGIDHEGHIVDQHMEHQRQKHW